MVIPLVSFVFRVSKVAYSGDCEAAAALADNLNLREGANGRKTFWLDVVEKKGD
jgi:hypothetical protein